MKPVKEKTSPIAAPLLLSLGLPLLISALSLLPVREPMKLYHFLNKPAAAPAAKTFPPLWLFLCLAMGIACFLVFRAPKSPRRIFALILYAVYLLLLSPWPWLFLQSASYLTAFRLLALIWGVLLAAFVCFFRTDPLAGVLLVPNVVWTAYAVWLSRAVYTLSLTPMVQPR